MKTTEIDNSAQSLFSKIEKKPSYTLEKVAIVVGVILMIGCVATPVALHFFHVPGIHLQHYLMFGGGFVLSTTIVLIAIASCMKKRHSHAPKQASISQSASVPEKTAPILAPKNILEFPTEILVHIFSFLDICSLGRVAFVCKLFNRVQQTDSLWLRFATQLGNIREPFPSSGLKELVHANYIYSLNNASEYFPEMNGKLGEFHSRNCTLYLTLLGYDNRDIISKKMEKIVPPNSFLVNRFKYAFPMIMCKHHDGEIEKFELDWVNWKSRRESDTRLGQVLTNYQMIFVQSDYTFIFEHLTPEETAIKIRYDDDMVVETAKKRVEGFIGLT